MHELSIAYNLVDIATQSAEQAGVSQIDVVYLRLGLLSGIVHDVLQFGYDIATKDTLLEGSRLAIELVPVVVYCKHCDRESEIATVQALRCPHCGTLTADIRQGKEIELMYLECMDETAYS